MPSLVSPVVLPGGLCRLAQPTLRVDELLVRPWEEADAPAVAAAYRDPDIQQWHARTLTDDEALSWVRSWPQRWLAESGASWAVVDDESVVGRVGFNALNLAHGHGEAAYWVAPAARGRGIATRTLVAVTHWMFDQVGLHRMGLTHSTANLASCRVAEKSGYVFEGTAVQHALHADGWHDMHIHARINGRAP